MQKSPNNVQDPVIHEQRSQDNGDGEIFGPWMLVRKTPRRRIKANTQQEVTNTTSITDNSQRPDHVSASRFEVLQSTPETHSESPPEYHNMRWMAHSKGDFVGDPLSMDNQQFIDFIYGNDFKSGIQYYANSSNLGKPPDDVQEEGQDTIQTRKDITQIEGAGAKRIPGLIRNLARMYHLKFITLLEPRISGSKAENAIKRMGFSGGVRMEAQGLSGGIWCMWRAEDITINVTKTTPQCIHLNLTNVNERNWYLSIVYARPNDQTRDDLMEELVSFGADLVDPWCVMGDFNAILYD
ncbi:Endonuclease/exonuclease/phosphatase superfamily [Sesbania bispinosa]|nr:Endonuclease/exonuclease/phosphatase superfamily [Sesbania bispinosa]